MSDYAHCIKPIEALLASLRVWILSLVAAILEDFGISGPIGRRLSRLIRHRLRELQYDLKRAIFLLAVARVAPPAHVKRFHPKPGYCVRRFRQGPLRLVTHGVFNRMRASDIRTRIARLCDVLENVEAWIARLVKRLKRGFNGDHRILAAPPVVRGFASACVAPATADSS